MVEQVFIDDEGGSMRMDIASSSVRIVNISDRYGADDMQSTEAAIAMVGERSRQSKEVKGS